MNIRCSVFTNTLVNEIAMVNLERIAEILNNFLSFGVDDVICLEFPKCVVFSFLGVLESGLLDQQNSQSTVQRR